MINERLYQVEGLIWKKGQKNTAFEEVYMLIAENEKKRKMDQENIKQNVENVEKGLKDLNFMLDQVKKQVDSIVMFIVNIKIERGKL